MRLLIVGSLGGEMALASKIAMQRGAKVGHADDIETALTGLRAGHGADLIMIDVMFDIGELVTTLESERFSVPVSAVSMSSAWPTLAPCCRFSNKGFPWWSTARKSKRSSAS